MNRIKKLPQHEAQKIAAGEVIDRPANIVKELIENSLDAQATQITIYIENGGKNSIRIIDNGCGMNEEDSQMCFEHHATSKITSVTDLETIASFGFRGEALSSISSVSNITLKTKEHDASHGTIVTICDGKQSIHTDSCPSGTDIHITDLFYNVPARKKFLKSKETETRHIQNLFQAFCLDSLNIHFKLFSDNTLIYNCPPTNDVQTRIAQLWDHRIAEQMIPISVENKAKGITISGVISNHQYLRYDRSSLFFFTNKRWVKNYGLSKALLKGYLKTIPPGRFPAAVISLTVNPHEIDINIHPRKEEVKFARSGTIEAMIQETVRVALEETINTHLRTTNQIPSHQEDASSPDVSFEPSKSVDQFFTPNNQDKEVPQAENFAPPSAELQLNNALFQDHAPSSTNTHDKHVQQKTFVDTKETPHFNLIGQYKKTYMLCEQEDGLYMIDQHAAHERILFEQFKKRFDNQAVTQLLFPEIITLGTDQIRMLEPYLSLFLESGINIELFGSNQLKVNATPVYLKNVLIADIIHEAIGWLHEYEKLDAQELKKTLIEKMHTKMACSVAVKAGDMLSFEQMQNLITELLKTENRFSCPHGRPTSWLLPLSDIEKKFKRDYRSY